MSSERVQSSSIKDTSPGNFQKTIVNPIVALVLDRITDTRVVGTITDDSGVVLIKCRRYSRPLDRFRTPLGATLTTIGATIHLIALGQLGLKLIRSQGAANDNDQETFRSREQTLCHLFPSESIENDNDQETFRSREQTLCHLFSSEFMENDNDQEISRGREQTLCHLFSSEFMEKAIDALQCDKTDAQKILADHALEKYPPTDPSHRVAWDTQVAQLMLTNNKEQILILLQKNRKIAQHFTFEHQQALYNWTVAALKDENKEALMHYTQALHPLKLVTFLEKAKELNKLSSTHELASDENIGTWVLAVNLLLNQDELELPIDLLQNNNTLLNYLSQNHSTTLLQLMLKTIEIGGPKVPKAIGQALEGENKWTYLERAVQVNKLDLVLSSVSMNNKDIFTLVCMIHEKGGHYLENSQKRAQLRVMLNDNFCMFSKFFEIADLLYTLQEKSHPCELETIKPYASFLAKLTENQINQLQNLKGKNAPGWKQAWSFARHIKATEEMHWTEEMHRTVEELKAEINNGPAHLRQVLRDHPATNNLQFQKALFEQLDWEKVFSKILPNASLIVPDAAREIEQHLKRDPQLLIPLASVMKNFTIHHKKKFFSHLNRETLFNLMRIQPTAARQFGEQKISLSFDTSFFGGKFSPQFLKDFFEDSILEFSLKTDDRDIEISVDLPLIFEVWYSSAQYQKDSLFFNLHILEQAHFSFPDYPLLKFEAARKLPLSALEKDLKKTKNTMENLIDKYGWMECTKPLSITSSPNACGPFDQSKRQEVANEWKSYHFCEWHNSSNYYLRLPAILVLWWKEKRAQGNMPETQEGLHRLYDQLNIWGKYRNIMTILYYDSMLTEQKLWFTK